MKRKMMTYMILMIGVLAISVNTAMAGSIIGTGNFDTGHPQATVYRLRNDSGFEVHATNYGGVVLQVLTPDNRGEFDDVVLGFDRPEGWVGPHPYLNGFVDNGNRIKSGRFTLDGITYQLARNNNGNHLHGADRGGSSDKKTWAARIESSPAMQALILSLARHDGEEGYPGNRDIIAAISVPNGENALRFDYTITTDQPAIVNPTSHIYWNLLGSRRLAKGEGQVNVLGHELQILADEITPVDATLIPTGKLLKVDGTPFDFRELQALGKRIRDQHEQLLHGRGYDHNWALRGHGTGLRLVGKVIEPTTGRVMEVSTTEPGVQVYTANYLGEAKIRGKEGRCYAENDGVCLETQHFPDSPNQPEFPSTVLRPGETFRSTTIYKFPAPIKPAPAEN